VAVIDRQTAHLTRLVDDLLDVARISRGKIELQRARLDFTQLVRQTVDDFRSVLEGHQVTVDLPGASIWIDGDATRLAQAVGNLLANAAKFTPEGGRIGIKLVKAGESAVLDVADTGVGIDAATRERLFEPFAQADRSLGRNRGGLGLGLALVKRLVELHGGRVDAESEGPGKGSHFSIAMPLGSPQVASASEAESEDTQRVDVSTVLVIEDNEDAADSLREILELGGHRVAVAYTGAEGLAKARELRPGLILCDIGLPDMDGYAVARAVRRCAAGRSAFLVAVTGYAQPSDLRSTQEAGFDGHLAKPVDLRVLEQLVADVLDHGGKITRRDGLSGSEPSSPSHQG
jgi:CheY-like chemotaxis protein